MSSSRRITSSLCVLLCVVVTTVLASEHSHSKRDDVEDCRNVQREFSHKKIGSKMLVPNHKVRDPQMTVCFDGSDPKANKSCCTKTTETKYVEAAGRYLKDSLRSSNAYLKKLVMERLAQFQEKILDLLEEAQNRTSTALSQIHKIPSEEHHGTVGDFFLDMEQYARRQHVNLHDSVQTFFTELFPSVFYYILSDPTVIRYDDNYRSCLLQSEEDVQPFGNVPKHLTHKIVQAFQRARSFVNALSVITEAINSTDHIEFDQNCMEAATKLKYCSHCQGYTHVRPCKGFCLNVIGGCLATVSEISPAWDELISVVGSLTISMKEKFSLEAVLNGIDKEISEAILQAMDDGPRIYNKIMLDCQNLTTKAMPAKNFNSGIPMSKSKSRRQRSSTYTLMEQLDAVLKRLMDSRGIYNRLATEHCRQSLLYDQEMRSKECWNGYGVGQYTKVVPESSFIAQAKANPEVRVNVRPNYKLLQVKEKLIHMKKNLSTLLTDEMMMNDGSEPAEYNSGDGRGEGRRISHTNVNLDVDDEDLYGGASGSGSGAEPTGEPRPKPTYTPQTPKPKPSSGTTVAVTWSVVAVCYTFLQTLV